MDRLPFLTATPASAKNQPFHEAVAANPLDVFDVPSDYRCYFDHAITRLTDFGDRSKLVNSVRVLTDALTLSNPPSEIGFAIRGYLFLMLHIVQSEMPDNDGEPPPVSRRELAARMREDVSRLFD